MTRTRRYARMEVHSYITVHTKKEYAETRYMRDRYETSFDCRMYITLSKTYIGLALTLSVLDMYEKNTAVPLEGGWSDDS